VFCPDTAVAAGGQVRVGAGQRAAPGERVEHRPAWPGQDAGPDPAAAEPRELGHLGGDGRGAPVRCQGPGGGGAASAAGRDGDRCDRRDRAGKGRPGHLRGQAAVPGCAGKVANGINTVHLCCRPVACTVRLRRSRWRRMRDSNSRGVAPNTLSNNAHQRSPMAATVRDLPGYDTGGHW
jgi:hypothetical protein